MNIDTFDIGEVILVTTPRFFNYSFNPLSLYYCYSHEQKEELKLVVLEVHNTFNERHLYICNDTTKLKKTRSGFHSSYRVNRSFHVSPFNNRSGCYEIHLTDIKKKYFECSMTIKNYQETKDVKKDKDFKRFFAQVKVIFANFDNLKFNVSKDILAIKNNNIGAEVNYDIENSWLKLHKVKFYRFKELRHSLNLMAEKFFNQFINFVEHPLHLDKRIESYHKNYNSPQTKDQLKGLVLQENDIPMLGYLIEFQIDDLIFWENLRYCVFSKVLQEFKDNEITGF
ncbi:hypothetical protein HDU92_006791 [Lobulomyces angularis]|nr:hypothetical protein HDU92_006791 [Lobulomyces angularis]